MNGKKENYFILLGLIPPADDSKIKAAIKGKPLEWSKRVMLGDQKAQHYLDQVGKIQKIMMDPELRRAESDEAIKIIEQENKKKYEELDDAIRILSLQGKITNGQLSCLIKKFSVIPAVEIRKRIKVPITPDTPGSIGRATLDNVIAGSISESLKIVEGSSLYDFLGVSPTSSLETLQRNTSAKYRGVIVRAIDAVRTASEILVGHCTNVFATEEMRSKYDATLALEKMEGLNKLLSNVGDSGMITAPVYDALVLEAVRFGIDKEEAERHINDCCKDKKWVLEKPVKLSLEQMKQCGACGALNFHTYESCGKCGKPLVIPCPKCKQQNPSTARVCSKCKFPVGDTLNAPKYIEEGNVARIKGDLETAIKFFERALEYWPGHPEAKRELEAVKQQKRTIDDFLQKLKDLLCQRLFYQAKEKLGEFQRLAHSYPDLPDHERTIDQRITDAKVWVSKAKNCTSCEEKISVYSKALDECRDCKEAEELMAKCPPDPPKNLTYSYKTDSILLSWSPTTTSLKDVFYRVVRKTGTATSNTSNSSDDNILGTTVETSFEDTKVEPGEIYYYSVFAVRGKTGSQNGILSPRDGAIGPCMLVKDVKDAKATAGDGYVNLTWDSFANVNFVEIWYKEGVPPTRRYDGKKLPVIPQRTCASHSGLVNGRQYHYLILTFFKDHKGNDCCSQGVSFCAIPQKPPVPVSEMNIQRHGQKVEISWPPLTYYGEVQILRNTRNPDVSGNGPLRISELNNIFKPNEFKTLKLVRTNCVEDVLEQRRSVYYIPVTMQDDCAVIGKYSFISCIDDIQGLVGYNYGEKLQFFWKWPENVQMVKIGLNSSRFPVNAEDKDSTILTCTRAEYELNGGFWCDSLFPDNVFVRVFSADLFDGKWQYSLGTAVGCSFELRDITKQRKVKYEIKREEEKFSITMTPDKLTRLPQLVLMGKIGSFPLNINDGKEIRRISFDTECSPENPCKVSFPQNLQQNLYCKLFAAKQEDHKWLRLIPDKKF